MPKKIDIIDLLVKQGLITYEQVSQAKEDAKRTGLTIEQSLGKMGLITEEDIARVSAQAYGVPYIDLSNYIIDAQLVKLIPESMARKYKVVPILKIGRNLTVAMTGFQDIMALDQIRNVTGMENVELVMGTEKEIVQILDSYYGSSGSMDQIVESLDKQVSETVVGRQDRSLAEIAGESSVIKLVNVMIIKAVRERVSDIHVEPEEDIVRIRYRIDGLLHEVNTMPVKLHRAIVSRIKILSSIDIAENRKPQDGRVRLRFEDRDLDIRVSTFPTVHGENVVMRLLDKFSLLLGLSDLGMDEGLQRDFDKLIRRTDGIILVTGPTGCGKTTTLYSALSTINSMEKNIITIEDPVEYGLPLIRQTAVNAKAGITFSNGLRSILRQDPDVIMVGEIRDKETADISIQAALTGHLVLSTLHTNDAASSLVRFIDMEVEPFLISSSVIGILAQRLVRKICDKCKEPYSLSAAFLKDFSPDKKKKFYRGKGCSKCRDTGFFGRTGIFELLIIDDEIRKMIESRVSVEELKKKAVEKGMKTLSVNGMEKVRQGITSPDEILRVTEVLE